MGTDLYYEAQMRAPAELAAERAENAKLRKQIAEVIAENERLRNKLGYERVTNGQD